MTEFSIPIVVKGIDCKILFPDKDTKDKYLKEEYNFCIKAYISYSAAFGGDERKKAKTEYDLKRVACAIHKGYGAKRGNKKIWVKQKGSSDKLVA